jgi:hypothetical protein
MGLLSRCDPGVRCDRIELCIGGVGAPDSQCVIASPGVTLLRPEGRVVFVRLTSALPLREALGTASIVNAARTVLRTEPVTAGPRSTGDNSGTHAVTGTDFATLPRNVELEMRIPVRSAACGFRFRVEADPTPDAGDAGSGSDASDASDSGVAMADGSDGAVVTTDATIDVAGDAGDVADARDAAPDADATADAAPPPSYVRPAPQFAFRASMAPSEIVPPVFYQPPSVGTVNFTLSADQQTLTLMGSTMATAPITVRVSRGLVGTNGTGVATFTQGAASPTFATTVMLAPADQLALQDGRLYVEYEQPMGTPIARGQIVLPDEGTFGAKPSHAQTVPLAATPATAVAQLFFGRNMGTARVWLEAPNRCATAELVNAFHGGAGAVLRALLPVPGAPGSFALSFTAGGSTESTLNLGRLVVQCRDATNAPTMRAPFNAPGTTVLTGQIAGANVVPPEISAASGWVVARLNFRRTNISYQSELTMLTPTAATANNAAVAMNGPSLGALSIFADQVSGSFAVTPAQADEIVAGRSYVQVSSARAPAGEARAQMSVAIAP